MESAMGNNAFVCACRKSSSTAMPCDLASTFFESEAVSGMTRFAPIAIALLTILALTRSMSGLKYSLK